MPSLSPGRWAVGYNYLYVMTRILDEIRPEHILDVGLGVSTKLISVYFDFFKFNEGEHIILEHNQQWIKFFENRFDLSKCSEIRHAELETKKYKGKEYPAYHDISKDVQGRKFEVISIDAPYGGEEFSRRDIIEYIPLICSKSFAIVVDDAERKGEQRTIRDIESRLKESKIEFAEGIYRGLSDVVVIASKENEFLCTL